MRIGRTNITVIVLLIALLQSSLEYSSVECAAVGLPKKLVAAANSGLKENIRIHIVDKVFGDTGNVCERSGQIIPIGTPILGPCDFNPQNERGLIHNCNYNCTARDLAVQTEDEASETFDRAIKAARDFIQQLVSIDRVEGNLKIKYDDIDLTDCGSVNYGTVMIDQDLIDTGVSDTDLIIFFTARPRQPIGLSTACHYPKNISRPIAAHINLSPTHWWDGYSEQEYTRVLIHEMIHVLGFDAPTLKALNLVVTEAMPIFENNVTSVISPLALKAANEYFGAGKDGSLLTKIPLEDFGDDTSQGQHWEKRIFYDELMNAQGGTGKNVLLSTVTLGLLEDLGWYSCDKSKADNMTWGRNASADFVTGACSKWTEPYTRCETAGESFCSSDHKLVRSCSIVEWENALLPHYMHFSNNKTGGSDPYADYCPIYTVADCSQESRRLQHDVVDHYGSKAGKGSWCFTARLQSDSCAQKRALCYRAGCTSDGKVTITVHGTPAICNDTMGGSILVNIDHNSSVVINCPEASILCGSLTPGGGAQKRQAHSNDYSYEDECDDPANLVDDDEDNDGDSYFNQHKTAIIVGVTVGGVSFFGIIAAVFAYLKKSMGA